MRAFFNGKSDTSKKRILQRATLEFRNAIQQQPKDADGYYWLAEAFLGDNKVADAVLALRRATELKPGHAAAQLKLAELMIRSRDEQLLKEGRSSEFRETPHRQSRDEDALFTLAAAQAQLGKTEDAEKYLVMSSRGPHPTCDLKWLLRY